jgi:predicted metal-binding membrane protein
MMASSSKTFAGLLFAAAGLYQWSALKHACLRHCRSPLHFIVQHWRQGRLGALRMGLIHGLYCIGCCWVLMGLLFAGGVMNLVWIAAIALFVLAEKVWGEAVARASGVAMLGVGAYLLVV